MNMAIKELPSKEHTFTLSFKGASGRVYDGTFTYKIPNNRTKIEIKKVAARLSEGLILDADTAFLIDIFANLRHNLVAAPEWWKEADYGYELDDTDVVLEIFKECRKFENERFEKLWEDESASKAKV